MAVGDVYKLTCKASFNTQMVVQNSYYFSRKVAADPTAADALALANAVKELFRPQQGTTVAYTDWALDQVRGGSVVYTFGACIKQGGILHVGAHTGTLSGSLAGDALPPQVAMVTKLDTGLAGRRRRGRHYLCGRVEADQNVGIWVAGSVSALQTVWGTILTTYGPTGTDPNWQIGVWSNRIATGCEPAPVPPPQPMIGIDTPNPGDAFRGLTSATVRTIAYTQRRRTVGVGR